MKLTPVLVACLRNRPMNLLFETFRGSLGMRESLVNREFSQRGKQ